MKRLFLIFWLLATPVLAVEPQEMLSDPALEARAQALDHALRCVQCQSESIASSNAQWSADARKLVRELIVEGRSDDEVLDFFVARYGEFVLMRPKAEGANLVLWLAGPGLLILGAGIAVSYLRRRSAPEAPTALSAEEEKRLAELMGDKPT
ncbi:cytochrome c-type biogenesis protein [Ovoidimarina sediminis]|uniref:cytochrome c-type biogenesis protein n=1 Tax=Ovoidimarina sediminis TaxID=3079856 RepID=UPI00290BA6E1|nr:cytochrome c-type biogenesis protein [Rhodophyticola sp. MJ-SS7]MDU8942250.1 cytochrome c-type biogenesis protein [Rhodophyticola sp. MJ-SS7]